MLLACSFSFLALLAGCHDRQPAQSSAQSLASNGAASSRAPTAPPVTDDRPVIVAFGDSLTAGYGAEFGQSYPDYLQHDLDARGYRYRVVNEGISGNTSKDGVLRLPAIDSQHPAIVIVAFGGNDGLRGLPILDTQMNLETIISHLQQETHAKVILGGITLPPNYGKEYIEKFNAMYADQARDYHVPYLPFMLKGAYGVPDSMQNDGIHATAKGNRQVALNFLPLLLPMLQKPQERSKTASEHRAAKTSNPEQPSAASASRPDAAR